jgi:hypothetical protein
MESTPAHLTHLAAIEAGKYIEGKQYMHFFGDGEKAKELEGTSKNQQYT